MATNPLEILKKYWGYNSFKDAQKEVISSVINGNDTVALLPTGGGKSICFQVPTLLRKGVCVVISPLIALMNDQVKNLQEKGIKAYALTSKLSEGEIVTIFDNLQFGNYQFLYLSPEKLQSDFIQTKLKQINIQLIAIDEAHCISEWGHDFRPSYLNINILKETHPKVPFIALTATATSRVLTDIIETLQLNKPKIIKKSFYRSNLAYQIYDIEDKLYKVEQMLNKVKENTIIYTNTRRNTVEISNQLNSLGFASNFYHGGMKMDDKLDAYNNWMNETKPIIVATNAFGMGIDKPNVRLVIHMNLPQSIENYIQEAGRAGRDGKKAFSVVLKNKTDIFNTQTITKKTLATVPIVKKIYFALNQFFRISYGELPIETFEFNISEFCKKYQFPITITYNTLKVLERENILLLDENFNRKSSVKFITSKENIFEYCNKNTSKERLIKFLLRTYGGIFESAKSININFISNSLGITQNTLISMLKTINKDGIINLYIANSNTQILFLTPREDDRTINLIASNIIKQNDLKLQKITDLISFIENDKVCRNKQLLSYFDEIYKDECGICDVCISKKKSLKTINLNELSSLIIQLLKANNELSSKEIVKLLTSEESEVLFCIQILLEKNILSVTSQNKYILN